MHFHNYNEMFILALVALSIVGIVCLGLLLVLAIFVLRQKRDRGQGNNPQNIGNPPQNSTPPPNQPQDVIQKLDGIKKEIVLGTNMAIWGLAFAVAVYAVSTLFKNVLEGIGGLVLAFILLWMGYPNSRKWIAENPRHSRWLLYCIIIIILIIWGFSIHFVHVLPT